VFKDAVIQSDIMPPMKKNKPAQKKTVKIEEMKTNEPIQKNTIKIEEMKKWLDNPNRFVDFIQSLDFFSDLPKSIQDEYIENAVGITDDGEPRYMPINIQPQGANWKVTCLHLNGLEIVGVAQLRITYADIKIPLKA
jgi:hypothetical protein